MACGSNYQLRWPRLDESLAKPNPECWMRADARADQDPSTTGGTESEHVGQEGALDVALQFTPNAARVDRSIPLADGMQ